MSNERKLQPETLAVHAGQVPDPTTLSRAVPIYQTSRLYLMTVNMLLICLA